MLFLILKLTPMKKLNLHSLRDCVPSISSTQCDYFVEGCITALKNQNHQSGVILKVEGDKKTSFQLIWQSISVGQGWKEQRIIAENGGIAIAFFVTLELTPYQIIQQAIIGKGFDYWLGYKDKHKDYDPDNFFNARLEISGTNKSSEAEVNAIVKKKLKQTDKSDYLNIPAFVIVTKFGTPISKFIQKK